MEPQVHFAPACDQSPAQAKSIPSLRSPPVRRSLHSDFQSQVHPSLRLSSLLPLSTSASSTSGNSSGPSSIDSSLQSSGSQEEAEEQGTREWLFQSRGPHNHEEGNRWDRRKMTTSSFSSECGRLSRSSSASTLREDWDGREHPDLSELGSIADLSGKFTSLTAKKLMAGISIGSIDTLIEVTALMEALMVISFSSGECCCQQQQQQQQQQDAQQ